MLEVGGDWYDVFLVEPGVLAFVVGDVVGRGLGAASAMGQLRSAVRAVAAPGVGPARLLARLDRFVEQVEAAALSTLAYAELDLADGRGPVRLRRAPATGAAAHRRGRAARLGRPLHSRSAPTARASGRRRSCGWATGTVSCSTPTVWSSVATGHWTTGSPRWPPPSPPPEASPSPRAVRPLIADGMLHDEQGRDDVCLLLLEWVGGTSALVPTR